ncbi:hypothetical protein pipiens_010506 [Culex pipiens pipiens]|uniref:Lipocalin/cytosolic fatty-acid binding domain-containing protein n=1 Tax=Culex pipiens pipiens TaxID=38569 RepID=A0ABD1DBJ3_CULPP
MDLKCRILICLVGLMVLSVVNCQIPGFGGCPDYTPILRFNRTRFLGTWYEVERYFTVSEVATKCVSATYELQPDGKIYVRNALTNRFNNVQRVISGVMEAQGRTKDGRYTIQYQSFPYNYNATFMVLDTDYDSFAVIYSCSSIGPVGHTASTWVLARERLPPGPVMQRAYGVLDKFRINRSFFVKTIQEDCVIRAPPEPAYDPTESSTGSRRHSVPGLKGEDEDEDSVLKTEDELVQLRNEFVVMPEIDVEVDPVEEESD